MLSSLRLVALLLPAMLLAESRFIDEDTLEIIATGKAGKTGKPAFEKAACTDAARQMGSVEAIEVLVDKGWENVKGTVTKTGFADQMTRIVSGKVRGVKVMNVEMLEDPQSREVQSNA